VIDKPIVYRPRSLASAGWSSWASTQREGGREGARGPERL